MDAFPEIYLVAALLRGLPEQYETYKTVIKAQADELTIAGVTKVLVRAAAELAQQGSTPAYGMSSRVVQKQSRETRTCFKCGNRGHLAADCTEGTTTLIDKFEKLLASERETHNAKYRGVVEM